MDIQVTEITYIITVVIGLQGHSVIIMDRGEIKQQTFTTVIMIEDSQIIFNIKLMKIDLILRIRIIMETESI